MTTLGINSSDRDPQVGWELITHVTRGVPPDLIQARLDCDKAWKLFTEAEKQLEWAEDHLTDTFASVSPQEVARLRNVVEFQQKQAQIYQKRYYALYKGTYNKDQGITGHGDPD